MYSLFIDTHEISINLVLYKNGKIIRNIEKSSSMSHSKYIMPLISKLINDAKINKEDIKEIIVVNGPGSFTGVRLGITIAKTWAFCMNTTIKQVSSLDLIAISINHNKPIIVGIPDPKGYYLAKYDKDNNLIDSYKYLSKSECQNFIDDIILENSISIDYEKVYEYTAKINPINPHSAKPLYIKNIGVNNG